MSNLSRLESFEKIQKASVMVMNKSFINNLNEWCEYRKNIAIEMTKCNDDGLYKQLYSIYENAETNIKKLLGL
jgi:hypothetical protein